MVRDDARDGRDWNGSVTAGGSYEIAAGPTAARTARAAVDAECGGLPALARHELRLLVSELVTNSVRHGGPASDPILLRFAVGARSVRVAISDRGDGFDARGEKPPPGAESGYGLYLVDQIADRWGTSNAGGMTIWFELRRNDAGRAAAADVPGQLGRAAVRLARLGVWATVRVLRTAARRHRDRDRASATKSSSDSRPARADSQARAAPSAAVQFSPPPAPGAGSQPGPAEARRPAGRRGPG